MSLRKDVRLGDDKRPVSLIPSDEQFLYNIANGEILTDEFGNPLITEVDTYFLGDATSKRATSTVFCIESSSVFRYETVSIATKTATYSSGTTNSVGITTSDIAVGDMISGTSIPDGTKVSRIGSGTIFISNQTTNSGSLSEDVLIERRVRYKYTSDPVLKVQEQFAEVSEVSSTLLGVTRGETQLSLFSNVSSYGIDTDEFEFYSVNGGTSFNSWETRRNSTYGNRYQATRTEETQESAIQLTAFPTPYSYPYGPRFDDIGLYNDTFFQNYLRFISFGNQLYEYFDGPGGASYPSTWKDNFLNPQYVRVESADVVYAAGIDDSFAYVDTWTETWRDMRSTALIDPVTNQTFTFGIASALINESYTQLNTRPGYSAGNQRYAFLQSRRVFRYQPGRISGFTFGVRSSTEPVPGITIEWGISNPTDQYVFKIEGGQFSIVRRSTVPLERSVLERNGLTLLDQVRERSGDPFDQQEYWTIDIPRDKFNGDPLNSNGPSGYLLQPDNVTMYKIEFGWYGAIGARFYVYIPTDNGDARWVVVHTLVIENSLGSPCLQDSYFRLKYSLNIADTGNVRTPQYLYKYGSSYYIDGGDEGTTQIYSVSSKERTILSSNARTLVGIRPKDVILNVDGAEIENKKIIIPEELNISSDSLAEVKVVTCTGCPGFGHVYTPGIATTESGRYVDIEFTEPNKIAAINDSYFTEEDIGAKLIAPSIYNLYITSLTDSLGIGSFGSAIVQGYTSTYGFALGNRNIPGRLVNDREAGITTSIPLLSPYPYPVRLSNYNAYAAADFKFTGSEIDIQFVNPRNSDDYAHFADFVIGVTNREPDVSLPDTLNGFVIGAATTTVLPNSEMVFGQHSHSYASFNEEGIEQGESWSPTNPRARMGMDYRIPTLSNPAGGICSLAKVRVLDPSRIQNSNQLTADPLTSAPGFFIQIPGAFPNAEYNGGEVALETGGNVITPGARYVGEPVGPYFSGVNQFSHIEIDQSLGAVGSNFSLLVRPVTLTATGQVNSSKLFNYNPFPLYLVAKLKDNAQINNISVREKIGDFQRTISPKWYVNSNATIELYDGKTNNAGTAPTNFIEVSRQSSALLDIQNDQQLRESVTRDTLYVGANQTTSINMRKVFGPDRRVVTPDNNNIEATFITAKKIDAGSSGTLQTSLNFKEQ